MSKAKLTDKQKRFCDEYLSNGMNATQAAISAGYSPKAAKEQGSRLLTYVNIQDYIASKQIKVASKLHLTQEMVVQELARIGFSSIKNLFKPDGTLKPLNEWDDDISAAVSSIEVEEIRQGRKVIGHTKKVKLWSKAPALTDLSKYLGLFERDNDQKRPEVYDFSGLTAKEKLKLLEILSKSGKK